MWLARAVVLVGLASVGVHRSADAQPPAPGAIEIRLAAGSDPEKQGRAQLERILATWDLSRWYFTRTVQIQSGVIPHSHPVLTLNTNSLTNDTRQARSFVHEQLHWFLSRHHEATGSAKAELVKIYPDPPEDEQDRDSTYLHLLVGVLELDALHELFGETAARQMLGRTPFYTWVYREVLERPESIRKVLRKYHLESPDARR